MANNLFEEAFTIFRKFGVNTSAVQVLIENITDLQRAYEFAERVDEAPVWTSLARAQLQNNKVKEALDSFIKANDARDYREVVRKCTEAQLWEDLVRFLEMARKKLREPYIETELCFAYAKIRRLSNLVELISGPTVARVEQAGDRCFEHGMFEAAKILYESINHYAKLSSTLVKLGDLQRASDIARKANSTATWKEVRAHSLTFGIRSAV